MMRPSFSGRQTFLARQNFQFSVSSVPFEYVRSVCSLKIAAARTLCGLGILTSEVAEAIEAGARKIIDEKRDSWFNLPYIQGGGGTSIHMNVNEAIAELASKYLRDKGIRKRINPIDDVNRAQSTNDVCPSALRIACYGLLKRVDRALGLLTGELDRQAMNWKDVLKLGRTHLQDAVPTSLGAEMAAYAQIMERHRKKISRVSELMLELNLGGSAIGNGINVPEGYMKLLYPEIYRLFEIPVKPMVNLMSGTSSLSDFGDVSHTLVSLMADLSKMANDLRLMASGPSGGLGEIVLPELQDGSTIMPGKNNPVYLEAINQIYFLVAGNNHAIEAAIEAGQLELNVMLPLIVGKLIESLTVTAQAIEGLPSKVLKGIIVNRERCSCLLETSTAYATCLTPVLGYSVVKSIVKAALKDGKTIREVVLKRKLLTVTDLDKLIELRTDG